MRCGTCGSENRADAAFCLECGAKLARACASCGRELPASARFCDGCGTPVAAGAAGARASAREPEPPRAVPDAPAAARSPASAALAKLRDRPHVEGERRTVTVLFIDAVSSVAAGERTDAEELARVVQESTARMIDAVGRYEGTVTQFRGDGIMAIFGAPVAHEDSARRAVAAALAMREALAEHGAESRGRGERAFEYRIGINTGPVIVGTIGHDLAMDYSAVGDTVNLAARMEQWAPPGAIYLTQHTKRLVEDYVELRELGALEIKGKAEAVRAYEVVRELRSRTRLEASAARGLTPYVGREHELQALQAAFEQAESGRGQVVFIAGEPGVGKSRLLYEFRQWVCDRGRWLEGRCLAYGHTAPYQPIVEAVRDYLGCADLGCMDSCTEPASLDLQACVLELTSRWGGAGDRAAPHLLRLLSIERERGEADAIDPLERRLGILDALRALLMFEGERAPLVIVLEDVHWIDEQSEDALSAMVDAAASMRVMLLLTHRPGYHYRFGDRTFFNRLSLRSLAADASGAMLRALLTGAEITPPVRELVMTRAEGNPFFMEEVTHALLESGAVRRDDGAYVVARPEALQLPETVQEVILSRLDRLDWDAKEVVQRAAIIGREFPEPLLAGVVGGGTRLDPVLAQLKDLELIYETAYFPTRRYTFKHALTHDVALGTLLVERKRVLHREVAAAIESLHSATLGDHVEDLARHAYEGQDWARALSYGRRCAERARELYAPRATIEHLDRVIVAARHLAGSIDPELYRLRGLAHEAVGEFDAARADHEAALREASGAGDLRGEWQAHADLGMLWAGRDYARTGEHFERAFEIAERSGDRALVARSLNRLGNWYVNMGRPAEGVPRHDEALSIFRELDDARGIAESLDFGSMAGALGGDSARAWDYARQAAALYRELNDRQALANVLATLPAVVGSAETWTMPLPRFDPSEMEAIAQEALDTCRSIDWPSGEAFALMSIASMRTAQGRYREAREAGERGFAIAERIGHRQWQAGCLWGLGAFYLDVCAYDQAAAHLVDGLRLARETGSVHWTTIVGSLFALVDIGRGALDDARGRLRELAPGGFRFISIGDRATSYAGAVLTLKEGHAEGALRLITELLDTAIGLDPADLSPVPALQSFRGEALGALGRYDEAEADLRNAERAAGRNGAPPVRWRTLARLADVYRARGDEREAQTCAREALAIVEELAAAMGDDELAAAFTSAPLVVRLRMLAGDQPR